MFALPYVPASRINYAATRQGSYFSLNPNGPNGPTRTGFMDTVGYAKHAWGGEAWWNMLRNQETVGRYERDVSALISDG